MSCDKLYNLTDLGGICRAVDQYRTMQSLGYYNVTQINSVYLILLEENTWMFSWQVWSQLIGLWLLAMGMHESVKSKEGGDSMVSFGITTGS